MANQQHIDILKQGVEIWNEWRKQNSRKNVDLSDADLSGHNLNEANFEGVNLSRAKLIGTNLVQAHLNSTKLYEADLSMADLTKANLRKAILMGANLRKANLTGASFLGAIFDDCTSFRGANLSEADLRETNLMYVDLSNALLREAKLSRVDFKVADLSESNLSGANLMGADLSMATLINADLSNVTLVGAHLIESDLSYARLINAYLVGASFSNANLSKVNLEGADLSLANLVRTNLSEANLTHCRIYGISAWDVQLEGAQQLNLVITPPNQPIITVDNLKVAQFIYLLLNNKEIRDVIDTITSKAVLILGRFTPERKIVLDTIREELRKRNYTPVLFDFEKPANRDLTETVSTLAHLARFIIVDLTDPSSAPHEVATIIPHCVVPVQPLLTLRPIEGKAVERHEYAMFQDLRKRYSWVLPTFRYQDTTDLLASLKEHIIEPAEQKAKELTQR
jgi:uncharacterized protein YjbI with pentapeptide repeats